MMRVKTVILGGLIGSTLPTGFAADGFPTPGPSSSSQSVSSTIVGSGSVNFVGSASTVNNIPQTPTSSVETTGGSSSVVVNIGSTGVGGAFTSGSTVETTGGGFGTVITTTTPPKPVVAAPAVANLVFNTKALLWETTFVPPNPLSKDTSPVEVGVRFKSAKNGTLTSINFYRAKPDPAGYKVRLWSSTGTLLSSLDVFEGQSPTPGWQTIPFNPVPIIAGQEYVASYYASAGAYAADNGFFSTAFNNGALTAPAGANGVYRYGVGGGFPNSSFKSTNYWVTPVIKVADPLPTEIPTKPDLTGAVASGNTVELRWGASFTGLGEAKQGVDSYVITRNGITISTFDIKGKFALYYRDSGSISALAPNTIYTYTIAGRTADGIVGPASTPIEVRTALLPNAGQDARISLFYPLIKPTFESQPGPAAEIGLRVKVTQNGGYLSGLRFFQATGQVGKITGRVWDVAGKLLGTTETLTIPTTGGFGWRELRFAKPVPVNGDIVISYTSPTGSYEFTFDFFDKRFGTFSVGPLTAVGSTSGAPGKFPNKSVDDRNQFIDAIWSPFSDGRVSLWNSAILPSIPSATDSLPVEVGVRFKPTVNGTISSIRFFRGKAIDNGYGVFLWSGTGTLLASASLVEGQQTTPGWQIATFSPVAVVANQTYVASYYASKGGYAIEPAGLSTGFTEGQLSVLPSGGVYRYGAGGGFPTNSFLGSNYWVDPVLVPVVMPTGTN